MQQSCGQSLRFVGYASQLRFCWAWLIQPQNLFERLANDLGLEFTEDEDVSKTLLRKVVVEGAAFGDDTRFVPSAQITMQV
jgi:hypothetical protein